MEEKKTPDGSAAAFDEQAKPAGPKAAPAAPAAASEASEPEAPAAPAESAAPEADAAPAAPKASAGESAAPQAPVEPASAAPEASKAPVAPATPTASAEPQQPAAPKAPAAPQQPASAGGPASPATPAAPRMPERPQAPTKPQVPAAGPAQAPAAGPVASPAAGPAAAPAAGPAAAPAAGPAGPTGPAGAYPPPPAPGMGARSSKATVALVCGILAIVLSFIPLIGIVLGIVAIVFAGKAVREAGRDGKATGGRICGILGIVFAVLFIVFYLIVGMGVFAALDEYDSYSYDTSLPAPSYTPPAASGDYTAEEQPVADAVDAALKAVADKDSSFMSWLSTEVDDEMLDASGVNFSRIGVNSADVADWLLTDFTYSIDSVYVESDGTATVYVDADARVLFDLMTDFVAKLNEYSNSDEYAAASDEQVYAKAGELLAQSMAEPAEASWAYTSIELVKSGDTWSIDPDSMEEAIDQMFGLL